MVRLDTEWGSYGVQQTAARPARLGTSSLPALGLATRPRKVSPGRRCLPDCVQPVQPDMLPTLSLAIWSHK